jgi:hypothetical protein
MRRAQPKLSPTDRYAKMIAAAFAKGQVPACAVDQSNAAKSGCSVSKSVRAICLAHCVSPLDSQIFNHRAPLSSRRRLRLSLAALLTTSMIQG